MSKKEGLAGLTPDEIAEAIGELAYEAIERQLQGAAELGVAVAVFRTWHTTEMEVKI